MPPLLCTQFSLRLSGNICTAVTFVFLRLCDSCCCICLSLRPFGLTCKPPPFDHEKLEAFTFSIANLSFKRLFLQSPFLIWVEGGGGELLYIAAFPLSTLYLFSFAFSEPVFYSISMKILGSILARFLLSLDNSFQPLCSSSLAGL